MSGQDPLSAGVGLEDADEIEGDEELAPKPLRADVWRRFRQNKLALIGLIFIVLLILVAVFAPLIAPYGPAERTPGAFREPRAGVYAKPNSAATLTVPAGCDTPTSLSGGGAVIARTKTDDEHPAGFLATDEGNVCSGYTYTALANGTLEVTWAPPSNASIAHDLGVSAACKSVAGVYKPR